MPSPVNILRYIKLTTKEPLDQAAAKSWFGAVKAHAPSGTLASVQTTDNTGSLRSAVMVHRERAELQDYIIPLTRDLQDKEVEPILADFSMAHPEVDFDLECSSAEADHMTSSSGLAVDEDKYGDLCQAWAKRQHDVWLKDRTDTGWRYGPNVSMKNKTHPLIRPWYELPEQFRVVDFDQPQSLLDLLNDQGYAVIGKSELEGMMRLLRGGVQNT